MRKWFTATFERPDVAITFFPITTSQVEVVNSAHMLHVIHRIIIMMQFTRKMEPLIT